MATLISYKDSDGKSRRCSAICHNARGEICACICGGKNHGIGLRQATVNTQEIAKELVEQGMKLGKQASQMVMTLDTPQI